MFLEPGLPQPIWIQHCLRNWENLGPSCPELGEWLLSCFLLTLWINVNVLPTSRVAAESCAFHNFMHSTAQLCWVVGKRSNRNLGMAAAVDNSISSMVVGAICVCLFLLDVAKETMEVEVHGSELFPGV